MKAGEGGPITLILVRPAADHLPSFIAALERGWSPDTLRGVDAAREILEALRRDPAGYLANLVDREAKGPPIVLPVDGHQDPQKDGHGLRLC